MEPLRVFLLGTIWEITLRALFSHPGQVKIIYYADIYFNKVNIFPQLFYLIIFLEDVVI